MLIPERHARAAAGVGPTRHEPCFKGSRSTPRSRSHPGYRSARSRAAASGCGCLARASAAAVRCVQDHRARRAACRVSPRSIGAARRWSMCRPACRARAGRSRAAGGPDPCRVERCHSGCDSSRNWRAIKRVSRRRPARLNSLNANVPTGNCHEVGACASITAPCGTSSQRFFSVPSLHSGYAGENSTAPPCSRWAAMSWYSPVSDKRGGVRSQAHTLSAAHSARRWARLDRVLNSGFGLRPRCEAWAARRWARLGESRPRSARCPNSFASGRRPR